MEEQKTDYHDANSFPLNELDQTMSTTNLLGEETENTPETSGTTPPKGTDKNNHIGNKSYPSLGNLLQMVAHKKLQNDGRPLEPTNSHQYH